MNNLLSVLLFLLTTIVFSQPFDWKDCTYSSNLEKTTFQEYFETGEKDYIKLFSLSGLSGGYQESWKSKVNAKIEYYKSSRLLSKSEKKIVNTIYKDLHDSFFTQYEFENHFCSLFTSGKYNCVSASALYAICFDALEIPYAIHETPLHVYIVVYPNTAKIILESTDPLKGVKPISESFKRNYVQNLADNKLVSQLEISQKGVPHVFDDHYFNDSTITLDELIGIQYYNSGLYKLEKEQFNTGFQELEKAHLFFPREDKVASLVYAASQVLVENNYKDSLSIRYFVKLFQLTASPHLKQEDMIDEFNRMTHLLMIEKYKPGKFKKVYDGIMLGIQDSAFRSEITFLYNYERGRSLLRQGEYRKSLPYSKTAFSVKPEHQDAKSIFIAAYINAIKNRSNTYAYHSLDSVLEEFPSLKENKMLEEVYHNSLLLTVAAEAERDNFKEAQALLEKFTTLTADTQREYDFNTKAFGRAYSAIATYYFVKGYKTKARQLLSKGLKIRPDSYEMRTRLDMLNGIY